MPHSFPCKTCHFDVCVPDANEGKLTYCPECYSILEVPKVPARRNPSVRKPVVNDDPLGIEGNPAPRWGELAEAVARERGNKNYFSDQATGDFVVPTIVDEPTSNHAIDALNRSHDDPRIDQRFERGVHGVKLLTRVLLILCCLAVVPFQVSVILIGNSNLPLELGLPVALIVSCMILCDLTAIGVLAAALSLKSRRYFVMGMVLCVFPSFSAFFLLTIPLAIWGLMLAYDARIKLIFQNQWDLRPNDRAYGV